MYYGNTGVGYYIVSQQKDGQWKKLFSDSGIPTFLKTKGKDGWPDIENGGQASVLLFIDGMVKNTL